MRTTQLSGGRIQVDPEETELQPTVIRFEVIGIPKPQPRARSFVLRGPGGKPILKNGQPILRVHESGSAEAWKQAIALAAKDHVPMPPLSGPLRVDIEFRFPRPKAHFRANGQLKPNAPHYHTGRGDRDNIDKAILDTLTTIGMWQDDGQVCAGEIVKRYTRGQSTPPIELPGATIIIKTLEQIPPESELPTVKDVQEIYRE